MPQNTPKYQKGATDTFQFAADTDPFLRVYVDSNGYAAIAGVGVESVGVNWDGAVDISENVYGTVRFDHQAGTQVYVADSAISIGNPIYPAAGGKVSAVAIGKAIGVATSAATADGDLISAVPAGTGGAVEFVEATFSFGDMTDNADATGYYDLPALPAQSLVLGWEADVTVGFTGDTSASCQVGIAGNLNAFTTTAASVLAVAKVGAAAPGSGDSPYVAAATAPRVTITGAADFGSISAGTATVRLAYINFAA